jgi:hypothetical protein
MQELCGLPVPPYGLEVVWQAISSFEFLKQTQSPGCVLCLWRDSLQGAAQYYPAVLKVVCCVALCCAVLCCAGLL